MEEVEQQTAANVPPAANGLARQTAVRNIQSAVSTTPFPKWTSGANVDNFLTGVANGIGAAAWQVSEVMMQFGHNEDLLSEQFMAYFGIEQDVQVEHVVTDLTAGNAEANPPVAAGGLLQLYEQSNWLKVFDNSLAAKIVEAFADHPARDAIRTTVANEHRRCTRANPMQQSGALTFAVLKKKVRGEGEQHAEAAISWLRDEGAKSNYPTHVAQIGSWLELARKKFDQQTDITAGEFCKRAQRKFAGLFPVSWDFKGLARVLEDLDSANNRELHEFETQITEALNVLRASYPAKFNTEGGANLSDSRGYERSAKHEKKQQKKAEKKEQNALAKGTPATNVAPVKGKYGADAKNGGGKNGSGKNGGGGFGGAKNGKRGDKNNSKGKSGGGKHGGGKADGGKGGGAKNGGGCFKCGALDHWANDPKCPKRQNAHEAQPTQQSTQEVATPQTAGAWQNSNSAEQPTAWESWDGWYWDESNGWQYWQAAAVGQEWQNTQPSYAAPTPATQQAHFTGGHGTETSGSRPTLRDALHMLRR